MPYTRLFIIALVVGRSSAVVSLFMARLAARAAGCGRSCRTATSPRSAACTTGRVDALTFFIGSGLAGVAGVAVTLIGSDRQPDRHQLHRRRLPGRHRRRPRQAPRARSSPPSRSACSTRSREYWTVGQLGKAIVFVAVIVFLQFRPNGLCRSARRGLTA